MQFVLIYKVCYIASWKGGDFIVNLIDYKFKCLYDLKVDKKYAVKFEKLEKGKKISLLSDTMLKAMFQNENRIKYSAKFLSYFIDVDYEVILNNIKLGKNELDKEKEFDKALRCDYIAHLDDTILNIEVNNNSSLEVLERNMKYAHRLFSKKIKTEDNNYKYSQVIQINLNNFSFSSNNKIIDIYTESNEDNLVLSDKLVFIQIYVPNLRKKWYNEGEKSLSEREKYILALVDMDLDKLKGLGDEKVMNEYLKEAEEVSFEDGFGEAYDKEWALKDEGKTEEKIEIAKNMLKKKMDKTLISELTNLTEEEITALEEE
mgnify:FL=1